MKRLVIGIALLFIASAAQAGVRNCNATLVGQAVCVNATGEQLFYVSVPTATGTRLVDAIAVAENYQTTVACDPPVNGCTMPNPETKTQFADRIIKARLKAYMQRALEAAGEAAKEAAIAADPVPDIP